MPPAVRSLATPIAVLVTAALVAAGSTTSSPVTATAEHGTPATSAPRSHAADDHAVRVRRTYRAAATAVSDTVDVGTTIRIRGTAVTRSRHRAKRRRPVRLLERTDGRWQQRARKRTTRAGAFTFRVAAGDVAQVRTFRVTARRFQGLPAATTRLIRVEVVEPEPTPEPTPDPTPEPIPDLAPGDFVVPEPLPAGYEAAGAGTDWSYLFPDGSRWNPCEPIRWAYNPHLQGYAGLTDVYRAFAKISGVSDLQFQYAGETSWRYLGDIRDSDFPADQADLVVSWADETELAILAGGVVGSAGGSGAPAPDGTDVGFELSRGYLVLDNGNALPGGFDDQGWGQVLLHEALHSLGLGHAKGQKQVMYPVGHAGNLHFGAGDITGMTRVGLASGCIG